MVYAGSGNSLSALNAGTGALVWAIQAPPRYEGSPTVVNGAAYICGGGDGWVGAWALNATTGADIWYRSGPCGLPPAVVNGVVYQSTLWRDRRSGCRHRRASVELGAVVRISGAPAVANGVVYVTSVQTGVYALDASTGVLLWNFPDQGQLWQLYAPPVVADGLVYVISGYDGTLCALKADTGQLAWTYQTGGGTNSPPAVANGVLYVSSDKLYALNASTGALLYATAWAPASPPVVANGVIYVGSGYNLYAADASTGASSGNTQRVIRFESAPMVVNGMVYAAFIDGRLSAFGLPDQQMSEKFSPPQRPDPARLTPNWSLQPSGQVTPP